MRRIAVPLQRFITDNHKIIVGFPLYKQIPVTWLYNWLCMDKESVQGVVSTDGVYLPMAMETLVKMAYAKFDKWDRLVVFEHDMIPPVDAFERKYGDEHDIVGSLYHFHEPPHKAMAFTRESGKFAPLSPERTREVIDNPGLHEVDGVAMGFTSIHRRVFDNWDLSVPMWQPTAEVPGHDLHFCNEAKKQGFRVWLDSTVRCGHLTETSIDFTNYGE